MHFSIRRGRKNQIASIDGPELLTPQCGDFATARPFELSRLQHETL
jgi:hypothetical protein